MQITVRTEDAIQTLRANKDEHIEEFGRQMEGWKKAMEKYGQDMGAWAAAGGNQDKKPVMPFQPKDHTKDYDDFLEHLQHHILDTIELSEMDFQHVIKNEFGWRNGFLLASSTYTGGND